MVLFLPLLNTGVNSDDDHICTPKPPQEETIIEAYNETY